MNRDVINRLLQLSAENRECGDELLVPPPEIIAFNISVVRKLMQLKVEALASMAGISVSTIERVERGEKVSKSILEKVAIALGQEPDYFTRPRRIKTADDIDDSLEQIANAVQVRVGPLRTQRQLRELALCHGFLVSRPNVGKEFNEEISGLLEWLDLTSHVLTTKSLPKVESEAGSRELYSSVSMAVKHLELRGMPIPLVPA